MSDKPGIPIGYDQKRGVFSVYTDNRHLITFGPTRSGKGTTVIVPALLQVPHSVICIDPKGQNAAITARRRRKIHSETQHRKCVHFLNPFNELGLGTSRFNPLAHLSIDDPNIVADVRGLSEALILGAEGGRDSHWTDSARDLVGALILHLIETNGGDATLPDMRALLTLPDELFKMQISNLTRSAYPFIKQPAARFEAANEEVRSVLATARTQTSFLDDPLLIHVLSGSDFAMADLKTIPATIYLILPGRYMEAYARFFRLLITSAIDQLTARPGGHRTLFILDEFATLQNLGAISKAFGFAAGYNVQLWPFLQDLPQLKAIYGTRWESFVANAGLLQFFTPSDLETAEYVQRRSGTVTLAKESMSKAEVSRNQTKLGFTGVTRQYSEERVPLIPVEELMSFAQNAQVAFFAGLHSAALLGRTPYYQIDRLKGFYDRDPFQESPDDG